MKQLLPVRIRLLCLTITASIIIVSGNDFVSNDMCLDDSAGSCSSGTDMDASIFVDEHRSSELENIENEDDDYTDYEEVEELEDEKDACIDQEKECQYWGSIGECEKNRSYMLRFCPVSCDSCSQDLGESQIVDNEATKEIISRSQEYYENEVLLKPEYIKVKKECKNRHESCSSWVSMGECEANPSYMQMNCALACQSCLKLDIDYRCPLDPDAVDALEAGELNTMFENIVKLYNPTILSRPNVEEEEEEIGENVDVKEVRVNHISKMNKPWIIYIDNFISDEQCNKLSEFGHSIGYEQSRDVGKKKFDGTYDAVANNGRTSKNAWCSEKCMADPAVEQVLNKIKNATGIPIVNQEQLQLLRYEVGQFYRSHHDFISHHVERQSGPRILTFFLYLNDVPKGGGTKFTDLDITVFPKKGRALLWPSVLDSDLNTIEPLTHHEALSVEEGVKFGANAWIHLRDFATPLDNALCCVSIREKKRVL